ncbi:histone-lysine N-methyltransferase NSD2-like [Lineus longissimus]|uniref:histone-lysine N-methyltransferase NSD2-like n=1 Tax=Lineus longissimus TaxID=88925 RepID=UPI002B4DE886
MDAEDISQGQAAPPTKKLISPSGKHLLHRLPTFSGPTRIAQSKASVKEHVAEETAIHVVPVEETVKEPVPEVEPTAGDADKKVEAMECQDGEKALLSEDALKNTAEETGKALDSVNPTSATDEKVEKMDVDETAAKAPNPTPIKKRIRRSVSINSNASKNDSEDGVVNLLPESGPVTDKSPAASVSGDAQEKKKKSRHKLSPEELSKPSTWLVGDLVWSKVSGHPWWPCMISYDPILGVHTKLLGSSVLQRAYHVQYFGARAERGWSRSAAVIEFKGKDAFSEQIKNHASPGRNRNKNVFDLAPSKKAPWNFAVNEADEAMKLTRNDRKSKLTFQYMPPKTKSASTSGSTPETRPKEKKAPARKSTGSIATKAADVSHADLMNGLLQQGTKKKRRSAPAKKKRKSNCGVGTSSEILVSSGFDVYFEKNATKVKADHPQFTDDAVKQYLQHHWICLSHEQKQEYEGTVILEDQGGRRLSARVKKPSKKVLEAVDDMSGDPEDTDEESPAEKETSPEAVRKINVSELEGPRHVEDTLDDTINCFLYGDDYQKAIEEQSVVKSENKLPKVKKPAALGKPVEAKKIAGVRKAPKMKKPVGTNRPHKVDKRGQKRKRTEPVPLDSTDFESQHEIEEKPKLKRQRTKDGTSSSSSDGEKGRKKVKEDTSDTDYHSGKKPRKRAKVETPTESESDALEIDYDALDDDPNKPDAYNYKPGKVCQICEKPDDLIQCEGTCMVSFHPTCLGMTVAPVAEFKCDECLSGVHTCFACKKTDKETRRCSIAMCGKFYHEDCLKGMKQARIEGKNFICPLHGCATCYANNPKSMKANKGRLVRCIRCPTAYHTGIGDQCIAAGCEQITACSMICSKHFKPEKNKGHHAHVNVSWCFGCSKGGTLLCCESCPAAFHHQCLGIDFPEGSWYCNQCADGKRPLYDDIVWVKLGNYRWWPAVICHPRNVPKNIQDKKHQVGEFPVHFFGSKDYFWTHQARVFLFQDGDKGSRETANTKRLEEVFKNAVLEASEAFQNWKKIKEAKKQQDTLRIEKKPPPYKYIKVNVPVGNVTVHKADLTKIPRCECTEEMPCTKESDCLNRMLMYECHPTLCPAGEKCQNQCFQKRQYPEVVPYKTPGRGWGLKCRFDIKKGEFVNEYVGELIDDEECARRIKKAHDDNFSSFYLLTLDSKRVIDAGPKGNLSRFMNHSCEPNCVTQKWNVNGDVRVGLFATCDISAGSELTFNYNLDCLGNDKKVCCCGATRCSGFLGVPPKTASAMDRVDDGKKDKKKKKKKRKLIHKPKHEDDCFRCGEGGTLVMCDLPGCTKAYHMDCLTLDKLPYGKWICPWHHCDECGKKAVRKCTECPNSFCLAHTEGHITEMADGKLFCREHEDLIETYTLTGSSTSATSSEGETNGEDAACEDAEPGDQNKEKRDQAVNTDTNLNSNGDSSSSESHLNGTKNSSGGEKGSSKSKGKKKGQGRPRKASVDTEDQKTQMPDKEGPERIGHKKMSKVGKINESLLRLKMKQKMKKMKKANGSVKAKKTENNNDVKPGEQKDSTTTDDDEFPSLVIDIPGC